MNEMENDSKRASRRAPEEIWVNHFTEHSAQKFREEVFAKAKDDSDRPIIIYIDSYGGAVDSLAKMIATMDEIPNPKITVCIGKAMSCGAILLSHGDFRYCDKHSRVMVHEVSTGAYGDVHDVKNDAEESRRLNAYFMGLLAENCSIPNGYKGLRQIVKERDGREIYLDAKGSLEFGIIDEVGTPEIVPFVQYQVGTKYHSKYILNDKRKPKKKTKRKERGTNGRAKRK